MSITPSYSFVTASVKSHSRLISVAMAIVLTSGCASMSEQECLTANWLDAGFRDGRNGEPLTRIEDHRNACSKVGVSPDRTQYLKGRDQGILLYCTPENALQEGRQGRQYRNACPAHLEHRFLGAYQQGKQIYDADQYVEKLTRESRQIEQALKDEEDNKQRRILRQELRDIDRQLQRARDDLRHLEGRLNYRQWN